MVESIINEKDDFIESRMRKRASNLQLQKLTMEEQMNAGETVPDLSGILDKAVRFLENPKQLWQNGSRQEKEMVLNLAFDGQVSYKTGEGFKTSNISMPFKMLKGESLHISGDGGA